MRHGETDSRTNHDALLDYVVRDRRLADMLSEAYELLLEDGLEAREVGLSLLSEVAADLRGEA